MLTAWLAGDAAALSELYHGEGQWADALTYQTLLVERNHQWVADIESLLETEQGTILIGVGAGHVVGPDSLIMVLKQKGFLVQ